jgi:hypothetical protein
MIITSQTGQSDLYYEISKGSYEALYDKKYLLHTFSCTSELQYNLLGWE